VKQIHLGAWLTDGWFVEKMGRGRPTCFELSAGYSDAMCRLCNRPRTAWCSTDRAADTTPVVPEIGLNT